MSTVQGAVFLVTPGSLRDDVAFPSPSVADEMGQAKQKFSQKPERVIYLVDKNCKIQAVDQRAYISFDRGDIRSILEAVTALVRNLKVAGLFGGKGMEPKETPSVDIAEVWKGTKERLREACVELSKLPNAAISHDEFRKLLATKFGLSDQEINFVVRDLQLQGLASYVAGQPPSGVNFITLTSVGWELVRYDIAQAHAATARLLTEFLGLQDKKLPPKQ